MKINISPTGNVQAIYNDRLTPLSNRLGKLQVKRASNVEFNESTQQWEARLADTNELIASGPSRDQVIKDEISYLEKKMQVT